MPEPT